MEDQEQTCVVRLGNDGLSQGEYEFLQEALQIYRTDEGCTTPIENFIVSIVEFYNARPVQPSDIERNLKTCRDDFEDAISIAAAHLRRYPDLVRERLPSGWTLDIRQEKAR